MGQNNFLKWITVPPVVAIFTIMLARAMGVGNIVGEVDIAIWGLVWLLFIVMSVLYGLFIVNGFNVGLISLQALAQGVLLCPMSITYGARMFQWLGVIIAVCGASALVVAYNQEEAERRKIIPVDPENDVKRIPANFAITDDTGAILNLTDDMLEVLGINRLASVGKNISEWFSPVSTTAEINGKIWDIERKSIDDGKRFYFELKPKGLPTSNGDNQNESSGPAEFIDSDTQLHTYNYGMARISDELYRAGRYNHPVSAFMIRIVFPQLLPDDDMEKYVRPFRAYCARVMKDTRQTDTVIQAGEFQIIAVLSECPYQMVESIIERLTSIVNALCPTFEEFLHVTVLNVYETYEGGTNLPTAQELVDKLTQQMTRKYSATALSQ
ncbi:MAG: hypothetical protein IJG36_02680 [Synergistaceae bacterium]|nr:hypothetical protein [Synergistaceae bacterium]MBQ3585292.1 hypothetical protein [Synergistaceae bacterium]MBR0167378.1 hypothetical protein [Synergistaceae bacterium]MBR0279308.1 hypothetical protein [Synergistaceae bacterium]